ncbi:MAG TPA: FAD:protein FMN transferase [Thermoanaerobaculia bacterium]|jgi:thiamine biosynthesis lipoprotein
MKTTFAAALIALAAISTEGATRARYLMGTVCEITATSEQQIDAAFAEAERIEGFLSTWREDSELSRLNRNHAATVSPELRDLLARTLEWSAKTGGAFNPLVAPLLEVWKTRGEGAMPDRVALANAVARTNLKNATIDGSRVALAHDAEVEEGGFGKGYALDRMLARIDGNATINFGGQLIARGAASVTIADPAHRDAAVLALTLDGASLSTSSGSEKQFVIGGKRYSHLFDPRTGEALPPRGSVSVVASDALTADILSTALYVLGEDEGLRWADAHGIAAIFINPAQEIRRSSAARARLRDVTVLDDEFKLKD